MSVLTLTSQSVVTPKRKEPLKVFFETEAPLDPKTSLQFSFKVDEDIEAFLDRITADSIAENLSGYLVEIPRAELPWFRAPSPGSNKVDVDVVLHQWKGERHLGKWTIGSVQLFGHSGPRW